jgi:hypothetical protein
MSRSVCKKPQPLSTVTILTIQVWWGTDYTYCYYINGGGIHYKSRDGRGKSSGETI